ncbi:MAG: amidohydrolase [Synergistaceae bacterium]|jgi:predicted amidohydrolase YtcJ|nr:amidohydrolase [Synergistaceae bacterium]
MQKPDSIYLGGRVYTVDPKFSVCEALAVAGGRLLWVGSDEQVRKYAGAGVREFDLKGRAVLPGLVESHLHFLSVGEVLIQINCFQKKKEQILAEVKSASESLKPGEWIVGRGWNELDWDEPVLPTKQDFERAAPGAPVCLIRVCGHTSWVSEAALAAAAITRDTPSPVGGEIFKGPDGEPTGILTDTAAHMARSKLPTLSRERKKEAYLAAQREFFSHGLTFIHDMAANIGYDYGVIEFLKELYREGALKIGMASYVAASSAEDAYKVGPESGLFGDLYTVRGIKFFTDGSLGARSAWMLDDYSDRPGHRGNARFSDDELYELVRAARANGFQPATHAIGDAANRQVLNVYERVLREIPEPKDHRFRIEHSQILHPDDIARFGEIGAIPSMQFVHCTSDKNMTEDRIGAHRLPGAFAWRRMLDMGLVIPGGSDAPVELVNPYHGIYAGVTRKGRDGTPEGGWRADQKVTREEALRAFTIWGAHAAFQDHVRGSLEVGKRADFVVTDRDIMTCEEDGIKDIKASATIQGGELVYGEL